MKRNRRVGVTLGAAVLAMGILASAAQAAQFHSSADHTILSGSQSTSQVFAGGPVTVTCASMTLTGTQGGTAVNEVTIEPSYSECHLIIIGFTFKASVDFHSCDYRYHANGDAEVKCNEEGDAISISAGGCLIEIGEQTSEGALAYLNIGAHSSITVIAEAEGIEYSRSGATCGAAEGTDGTYSGWASLTGEDTSEEPAEIWVE